MLSAIAAIGKNRELGKNNDLLWEIPEDMQYFRDMTRGHTVIMGQRTFESIGHPLPNRTNIVMTQDAMFAPEGVVVARSMEEALKFAGVSEVNAPTPSVRRRTSPPQAGEEDKEGEIFIIGGASIYSLFLAQCDKLYLTLIDADFLDADVFFPEYEGLFHEVSRRESQDERYQYAFTVWEKSLQDYK